MFSVGVMLHYMMFHNYPKCNKEYLRSIKRGLEMFKKKYVHFEELEDNDVRSHSVKTHILPSGRFGEIATKTATLTLKRKNGEKEKVKII